jgi:hypothetical protein
LLVLARAPVELAKAEVAVGDERAHAEFRSERERRTVVIFGSLSLVTVNGTGAIGALIVSVFRL